VFESGASNLVPGDTNGYSDIFLRDRQAGTTVRVSLDASGAQFPWPSFQPAISADGRVVAFYEFGGVFVRTLATGITERVDVDPQRRPTALAARRHSAATGPPPSGPAQRTRAVGHQAHGYLRARPCGRHERAERLERGRQAGGRAIFGNECDLSYVVFEPAGPINPRRHERRAGRLRVRPAHGRGGVM
jgi:hypothetical protein